MTVPTAADWSPIEPGDLDAAYARKMFLGKSAADTIAMFHDNVLERAEDLQFMPATPFQYYVIAFRDYTLSPMAREHALDAPNTASSFLRLVEWRLQEQPDTIAPVIDELLPAVESVAEHQHDYDADMDIYGDFRALAHRIKDLAGRLTTR